MLLIGVLVLTLPVLKVDAPEDVEIVLLVVVDPNELKGNAVEEIELDNPVDIGRVVSPPEDEPVGNGLIILVRATVVEEDAPEPLGEVVCPSPFPVDMLLFIRSL